MNNLKTYLLAFAYPLIAAFLLTSCEDEDEQLVSDYKQDFISENIFLVIIDGPRYSESFGDPTHRYVPYLADSLAPLGVINDRFYNLGLTKTVPGHTAVSTGVYQDMENDGEMYPNYPGIPQLFLEHTNLNPDRAWVVTSKAKLRVLSDCSHLDYRNRFNPRTDAYTRYDLQTYERTLEIMKEHHPRLMVINFRGPDYHGHRNEWEAYLDAISETDSLLFQLWKEIEADPHYAGKTTMLMTNDHGRHLDDVANGFKSHGDKCAGCTRINFFAVGPDIKEGVILANKREQVDILPTISRLMGFEVHHGSGEPMTEIFK